MLSHQLRPQLQHLERAWASCMVVPQSWRQRPCSINQVRARVLAGVHLNIARGKQLAAVGTCTHGVALEVKRRRSLSHGGVDGSVVGVNGGAAIVGAVGNGALCDGHCGVDHNPEAAVVDIHQQRVAHLAHVWHVHIGLQPLSLVIGRLHTAHVHRPVSHTSTPCALDVDGQQTFIAHSSLPYNPAESNATRTCNPAASYKPLSNAAARVPLNTGMDC